MGYQPYSYGWAVLRGNKFMSRSGRFWPAWIARGLGLIAFFSSRDHALSACGRDCRPILLCQETGTEAADFYAPEFAARREPPNKGTAGKK